MGNCIVPGMALLVLQHQDAHISFLVWWWSRYYSFGLEKRT